MIALSPQSRSHEDMLVLLGLILFSYPVSAGVDYGVYGSFYIIRFRRIDWEHCMGALLDD